MTNRVGNQTCPLRRLSPCPRRGLVRPANTALQVRTPSPINQFYRVGGQSESVEVSVLGKRGWGVAPDPINKKIETSAQTQRDSCSATELFLRAEFRICRTISIRLRLHRKFGIRSKPVTYLGIINHALRVIPDSSCCPFPNTRSWGSANGPSRWHRNFESIALANEVWLHQDLISLSGTLGLFGVYLWKQAYSILLQRKYKLTPEHVNLGL